MKLKQITKKDGSTVYRTNVYLGVDSLTGKKVQTTATGKTRKACELKAKQAINNFIKNGSTVAREKVKFNNFEELAMSWFDGYKLTVKANSIKSTSNFIRLYIIPEIGTYKIDKISSVLLQNIVNQWAKNANTAKITNGKREKGNTKDYKLLLNIISRVFDYAIQLGVVSDNPAKKVSPPKLKSRTESKLKYFDNSELKKFLNYLNGLSSTRNNQLNRTLYKFMISTGLRIGEALALYWSDIDFDKKTVAVTKTSLPDGKIQKSTKTKESTRIVSLDNSTIDLLKKWKVFQSQTDGFLVLSNQLVFSDNDGGPFKHSKMRYILSTHFSNAKVSNIGFHGFRHTHASLLMNNDVNPKEIQARLGHADYSITMNIYSHLAKDKKKDTADKFESILKAL